MWLVLSLWIFKWSPRTIQFLTDLTIVDMINTVQTLGNSLQLVIMDLNQPFCLIGGFVVVADELVHILLGSMRSPADDWHNSNRRCWRAVEVTCHVWKRHFCTNMQMLWHNCGVQTECGHNRIWGCGWLQYRNRLAHWFNVWTLCSNHIWKFAVFCCYYTRMYDSGTWNKQASGTDDIVSEKYIHLTNYSVQSGS